MSGYLALSFDSSTSGNKYPDNCHFYSSSDHSLLLTPANLLHRNQAWPLIQLKMHLNETNFASSVTGGASHVVGDSMAQRITEKELLKNGEPKSKYNYESNERDPQASTAKTQPDMNTTPLAIVGMAMRLPGGIDTSEALWDLLVEKRDARCRVPNDRYNIDAFYSKSKKPGTVNMQHGYFLKDLDLSHLDASFFSMNRAGGGGGGGGRLRNLTLNNDYSLKSFGNVWKMALKSDGEDGISAVMLESLERTG